MLDIDLAAPRTYEVEEVGELPGTGKFAVPLIFFPPPRHRQEHDGLWLRVRPANGPGWVGVFAFGMRSSRTFSRVLSSPDPNRVCVVARGGPYIVRADQPHVWGQVPLNPVTDVRLLSHASLLILPDFPLLLPYPTARPS